MIVEYCDLCGGLLDPAAHVVKLDLCLICARTMRDEQELLVQR